MKTNYSVNDIETYLSELGFKWVDNLARDIATNKYFRVTIESLKNKMHIYLENSNTKIRSVVQLVVDNDHFIIKQGNNKLDMSKDWQDAVY